MPTYGFRCPDGHEFEKFYRKMSDAAMELPCPECGKPAVRLLSGGVGIHFKGSGFYLTDYGRNAHRKAATKPDSATTSSEPKSTDAKPAGESKSPSSGESKPASDAKPTTSKPSSGSSKSES